MRNVSLILSFMTLMALGSVGCKTAPQLAWWKTADKSAIESTAVARSAPELPSEVAMQMEGLTGSATKQAAAGQAPAFQPNQVAATSQAPAYPAVGATTNPAAAAYPSTGAAEFTTTPKISTPASTAMAPKHQPNLGSIAAMPYDPSAVPPVAQKSAPQATPSQGADRYAHTALPSTNPVPSGSHTRNSPASTQPLPTNSFATTPTSPAVGDRYGMASSSVLPTTNPPVTAERYASVSTPVSPSVSPVTNTIASTGTSAETNAASRYPGGSVLATATAPYRPGGTSSYPSASMQQSPVAVASRPVSPSSDEKDHAEHHTPAPADPQGFPPRTQIYR